MDLREKIKRGDILFNKNKLNESLQLTFLKRLHELLQNGYSLLASLDALIYEKKFNFAVTTIVATLREGEPIDIAFQRAYFHSSIISYLYFIRLSGDLEESVYRCVEMMEQRLHYKEKMLAVIRYPIFLFFIFTILLFFVKSYILPSFEQLFQSSSQSFVTINRSLVIINLLMYGIPILVVIILLTIVCWMYGKNKLTITKQMSLLKKIPVYYTVRRMQTSFMFAIQMSMYLSAGLSLKQVLEHLASQKRDAIIAYYASLLLQQLNKGLPITETLKQLDFLDEQIGHAFEKESETSISNDLHGYAIYIADKLHHYVMKWIAIIQPLFFGILACLIIFVYMSLLYPMFEFMQNM